MNADIPVSIQHGKETGISEKLKGMQCERRLFFRFGHVFHVHDLHAELGHILGRRIEQHHEGHFAAVPHIGVVGKNL